MIEVLHRTVLSFLLITVAVLWTSCGNDPIIINGWPNFRVVGVVKDKETLEPLHKVVIGLMHYLPDIPDSVLIVGLMHYLPDIPDSVLNDTSAYPLIEGIVSWQETGKDGAFEWPWVVYPCSPPYSECMRDIISRTVAWESGYKLWRYNARRDTIFEVQARKDSLNIYMEKLDND